MARSCKCCFRSKTSCLPWNRPIPCQCCDLSRTCPIFNCAVVPPIHINWYRLFKIQVVLSACSSYFRSLFVDHPSRHPIVILKDVGLEELRTLVDFMYKGEVNVQYCQLPALLKTAESLQVPASLISML